MIKISLCMIVKNEEAVLERCLKSVGKIADEIIIVDTGSKDSTKNIAKRFTPKVYDFEWIDDFSAARNYSFSFATQEYVMWLDADDVISAENRKKILQLKRTLPKDCDIVTMKYDVFFDSNGNTTFQSTRGRLFKREKLPHWQDEIHEYIPLAGKIFHANDISVSHKPKHKTDSNRNLKIYQKIIERTGTLSPRGKYYYARELKDHLKFEEAVKYFSLFLDEGKGWMEDNIAACYNLAECYKHLQKPDYAFDAMQRSFRYDAPRPEICCLLAYHYRELGNVTVAISWFETALNLPKKDSMGFVLSDFHRYVPALELAVCFDILGQHSKANFFNEIAGTAKPDSPQYLQNKEYFKNIQAQKTTN